MDPSSHLLPPHCLTTTFQYPSDTRLKHPIVRYAVYVTPMAAVLAIPLVEAHVDGIRLLGLLVWLEILWFSFWAGKLIAHTFPYVFQLCGFIGVRNYKEVLRQLKIPFSLLIWTVVAWATVPVVEFFEQQQQRHHMPRPPLVNRLRTLTAASVAVSALFLGEKLIVQLIAINYHQEQFNDRLIVAQEKTKMLEMMYEASIRRFPMYCEEFYSEDMTILSVEARPKSGFFAGIGRVGDASTFGNMASDITGDSITLKSERAVVDKALQWTRSTEALAKRLWMSSVGEGKTALYRQDIVNFLEPNFEDAHESYDLLDADNNGDIGLEEMIMTVVAISKERKSLVRSRMDAKSAVRILDRFLLCVVAVLVGLMYAAFLIQDFATYLATVGTQVAAVSFAIAGTVQEFLGCCIFLFVKHPYDVGDLVEINDIQFIVEHISLLYTVFRKTTNKCIVQTPNITIDNYRVVNISRSKAIKERISISINADISFEDLDVLRNEIQAFLVAPDNKRHFLSTFSLDVFPAGMKQLELRIEVTHKSHNGILHSTLRNKLTFAIYSALRSVPIRPPGQEKVVDA